MESTKEANCKGNTNLMYSAAYSKAKAVCQNCPIQLPCLEYALSEPELHGVWGGYTADERHHISLRRLLARRSNYVPRNNTHEREHLASASLSSQEHTSYSISHTQVVSQKQVVFRVVFQ